MPADVLTEPDQRSITARSAPGSTAFGIRGMTCGNCARHVTDAIQSVAGVQSAQVSLDSQQATVRWKPGAQPDPLAVIKAVEQEGFGAKVMEVQAHGDAEHNLSGWRLNLWLGLPATAILMFGEWGLRLTQ